MHPSSNRREFLNQVSHSAAAVAAVSTLGGVHLFADEKPSKINLGIIGCGGIMTLHVRGLVERGEQVSIAWLCDVDPAQIDRMDAHVTRRFQATAPKRTSRQHEKRRPLRPPPVCCQSLLSRG